MTDPTTATTALTITLLGTGTPLPDADRAGPATLIEGGGQSFLVDAGRGVLMRVTAAGGSSLLDDIERLLEKAASPKSGTFEPTPLNIVGPPGIAAVVEAILASLGSDICYRMAHHDDLTERPMVSVTEVTNGPVPLPGPVRVSCAPTDHRPADPSIGFRFDHEGAAVVTAGDTVPCAGLDGLCQGAQALVHTAIRKDVIAEIPIPRLLDVLDYHSSPEEAAQTAQRAAMDTLVLTHYMPAFPSGGGEDWRARTAEHFDGTIELGDDLHRVEVPAPE